MIHGVQLDEKIYVNKRGDYDESTIKPIELLKPHYQVPQITQILPIFFIYTRQEFVDVLLGGIHVGTEVLVRFVDEFGESFGVFGDVLVDRWRTRAPLTSEVVE